MSEMKCPVCGETLSGHIDGVVECKDGCSFRCGGYALPRIAAAMELAKATRTLENTMAPLNSGKLKMGQALPAIRIAMEDQKACEQRVLEVFK